MRVFGTEPLLAIIAYVGACMKDRRADRARGPRSRPWTRLLRRRARRRLRVSAVARVDRPRGAHGPADADAAARHAAARRARVSSRLLARARLASAAPSATASARHSRGSPKPKIPDSCSISPTRSPRIALPPSPRVLSLGVNTGDELALLIELGLRDATFVGVDHSKSALAAARSRFGANVELIEADLGRAARARSLRPGGRDRRPAERDARRSRPRSAASSRIISPRPAR